jgi:hypothetical protein
MSSQSRAEIFAFSVWLKDFIFQKCIDHSTIQKIQYNFVDLLGFLSKFEPKYHSFYEK